MSPEQMLQALSGWHDFYLLTGAAEATLLGRLFVAVPLKVELILPGGASAHCINKIAEREQAFQNYIKERKQWVHEGVRS
jgi:hypothetical protein